MSGFGEFVKSKREEKGITQKKIAAAMGVTAVYICDIEKNRRYPPTKGRLLNALAEILELDEVGREEFYELAGAAKKDIPPDLLDYILSSEIVRKALRAAKERATLEDWEAFLQTLNV